jgi:sugar phosphate isomerase/epimerase
MAERDLVASLLGLAARADAIVMHPDTIESPEAFLALAHTLVLENMDAGKSDGCNVEQLARSFAALPHAGFCFDIAHAWSLDPSMGLAAELLDAFRSRLRHVHVSSLSPELHHIPLTEDDEELFMPLLERCLDVPWILEAPPREI